MRPPAGCIGVVCPDRLRHGRRQSLCCGRAVDRFRPSGLALQSHFRRLAFPFLDGKCPHAQRLTIPITWIANLPHRRRTTLRLAGWPSGVGGSAVASVRGVGSPPSTGRAQKSASLCCRAVVLLRHRGRVLGAEA